VTDSKFPKLNVDGSIPFARSNDKAPFPGAFAIGANGIEVAERLGGRRPRGPSSGRLPGISAGPAFRAAGAVPQAPRRNPRPLQ